MIWSFSDQFPPKCDRRSDHDHIWLPKCDLSSVHDHDLIVIWREKVQFHPSFAFFIKNINIFPQKSLDFMFPYLKWSLWEQNPKKFILSAEHCAEPTLTLQYVRIVLKQIWVIRQQCCRLVKSNTFNLRRIRGLARSSIFGMSVFWTSFIKSLQNTIHQVGRLHTSNVQSLLTQLLSE